MTKTNQTIRRRTALIGATLALALIAIISACMTHTMPTQNMAPPSPGPSPYIKTIS